MIRMSTFKRGGVHPHDKKELSKNSPIEVLPMPETLIVPMSQHIGKPAVPAVSEGDTVKAGDLAGAAAEGLSANIYTGLGGTVTQVTPQGIRIRRREA